MKVYAVKRGYKTGIFDNWNDCQNSIRGFSKPEYKSFNTNEEAQAYLADGDYWIDKIREDNAQGFLVAFTDGGFDKSRNRYSYGVQFILPNGKESDISGNDRNELNSESDSIIGEIFGILNALDWARSHDYKKIKIYHDYEGLSKWITNDWAARSDAAKFYLKQYEINSKDFIQIEFEKIPKKSNIVFKRKAEQLSRAILINKKENIVKGDSWFTIPYFKQKDFEAFVQIIEESDQSISHNVQERPDIIIYKFVNKTESVTVTLYKTGEHKLLLQGKNSYLFQVITSTIIELYDDSQVEEILEKAYCINIERDEISNLYNPISDSLPPSYPEGIKRLIKQSLINLLYYAESEDYTMYVFPILRALEGHIKYLLRSVGINSKRSFSCFARDPNDKTKYIISQNLTDKSKNTSIENCYNYYKAHRDTLFHFGDLFGEADNTRIIESKEDADTFIKKSIDLILSEQ